MRMGLSNALMLIFVLCPCATSPQSGGLEQLNHQIDTLLSSKITAGAPGLAITVLKHGRVFFEKGYGMRDLRSNAPIDAQTNFRLASVTKQFTAMAVMLLVHDGKLRYEDTLATIWPNFPAYGKTITVRQLLTHTSGLPDYEELMEQEEKVHGSRWTVKQQIQDQEVFVLLKNTTKGKFAPGTSWAYSNSGYVVLGSMVAKISGMPYGDFLQQRIIGPLDMKQTIVYARGKNEVPHRAYGHSRENGAFVETDQSPTSATLGDGGIYSNVQDLAKWDAALRNYTLLSPEEMKPALTPARLANDSEPHWPKEPDDDNLAPGRPVSYGFGWFLDPYNGHQRMWHTGTTMGFRNAIQRFTTDGLTIVILGNRTDLDAKALSERIADLVLTK
jgi:CubicO group peptidase (beta-lactamase class C family)